ncbi:alpha-catulin isoform X2 [Syngnathus scovelli]|uniref:alpha-catulin isoform X2 n=1 Tax=Syngnathus scovelli TaxID=161590 RepID=UPI00210F8B97|nr:alpha-catulin isoform X2 [Syngnathus scovelli]
MASPPCGNLDSGLEIKTRSVEQTLIPLVSQITTLINHKERPRKSERTLVAIQRVGQAVSVAVGRFVAVGEAIALEHHELKDEMGHACFEARRAGDTIAQLTEPGPPCVVPSPSVTVFSDRSGMVKAARLLLSSVTKVLVLADRIVIKQIVASRNKVLVTLEHLERVSTFQGFVHIFSQFGNEMVDFAHLTGDRQNDLKDERKKARMAAARAVLEKCTMMLLTASKTCLRHPDCESARINKDAVFQRMRCALEQVVDIVTEARGCAKTVLPASICDAVKDYKMSVESLRDKLAASPPEGVGRRLEALVERTEDFTDSPYTGHQQRQAILALCQLARQDARQLLHAWTQAQSLQAMETSEELEVAIAKSCQSVNDLRRELHKVAVGRTFELLRMHAEHSPLRALKAAGAQGDPEAVAQYSRTLTEQKEQLVENCRLLCHVCGTKPLEITCVHAQETFHVIGPQIVSAAQTLALHPSSKIAKENLDVFCEAWESQLADVVLLLREIDDVLEGKQGDKRAYLSLPRTGKHAANTKSAKPVELDAEEQSGVAKVGLELRLLSSDVDAELEKWEEQEQQVVRHSQSVASMAYNMYLFTRGEGLLKTTLDLFRQAEVLLLVLSEEGLQLCSSLQIFSTQLVGDEKLALMSKVEKLLVLCQQLQAGSRTPVLGKSATFQKVDSSIQTTRSMLTLILNILPACNKPNAKSKSEQSSLDSPQDWRPNTSTPVRDGEDILHNNDNNDGSHHDEFAVKAFEQHLAGLNLLESN